MPLPRLNYYQYKPITADEPLDAYKSAVDSYTKQYDETEDKRDAITRALSSVRTSKAGQEYLNKLSQEVNKSLEEVSNTVQGTKNWAYGHEAVRRAANKVANDKVFQALQVSQKNEDEGQKTKAELAKKGGVVNIGEEYDNYKPLNEDGTVNIYRPEWQQEADYMGTALDIAKDIPTIATVKLGDSPIKGFNEVHTINEVTHDIVNEMSPLYYATYIKTEAAKQKAKLLSKQLRAEGKSDDEIAVAIKSNLSSIVNGAIQTKAREAYKDKADLVKDDDYAFDRQYRKELELIGVRDANTKENDRLKAEYRAKLKKSGGKDVDSGTFLSTTDGLGNGAIGDSGIGAVTKIDSEAVRKNLKGSIHLPAGENAWDSIKLDSNFEKNFKKDDYVIDHVEPEGIVSHNTFEPAFDGAIAGRIYYNDKVGKAIGFVNGYVKNNGDSNLNGYRITSEVKRSILDLQNHLSTSNEPYKASVIKNATSLFVDENSAPRDVDVHLEVIAYNEKGKQTYKVKPCIIGEGGKLVPIETLKPDVKARFGLTDIGNSYNAEQLRNLADNQVAKLAKAKALPVKDLSTE